MAATPYNASFFDQQVAGSLASAGFVLPLLLKHFRPGSVVDAGCGVGPWLTCAHNFVVGDVLRIDGDYVDRSSLLIDPVQFRALDLNEGIAVNWRYEAAVTVEISEEPPIRNTGCRFHS